MDLHEKTHKIGYLLRKAQHAIRLKIERELQEYSITLPQFSVLTVLSISGTNIHSADVARTCMFSPQATNVIINNLEKSGLITRTKHKTHGRILAISLTAKGIDVLALCRAKVDVIETNMMRDLTCKEEQLIRSWLSHCISDKF